MLSIMLGNIQKLEFPSSISCMVTSIRAVCWRTQQRVNIDYGIIGEARGFCCSLGSSFIFISCFSSRIFKLRFYWLVSALFVFVDCLIGHGPVRAVDACPPASGSWTSFKCSWPTSGRDVGTSQSGRRRKSPFPISFDPFFITNNDIVVYAWLKRKSAVIRIDRIHRRWQKRSVSPQMFVFSAGLKRFPGDINWRMA